MFERGKYGLIFLDLLIPDLRGDKVFKSIRYVDKDVPVVIITGYPDSDVMSKAMELGPFMVVKKPFESADILKAAESVF